MARPPKPRTVAQWDGLDPSYKKRITGKGITREDYLSGAPLTVARGHLRTPEHPREANRPRYADSGYIPRKSRSQGIRMLTTDGVQYIYGTNKSQRSKISAHHRAIGEYLSGEPLYGITIRTWRHQSITVDGEQYDFEYRADFIDDAYAQGDLEPDSIYDALTASAA